MLSYPLTIKQFKTIENMICFIHCILTFFFLATSHQGSTGSCTHHFDNMKVEKIDFSNGLKIADIPQIELEKNLKIDVFILCIGVQKRFKLLPLYVFEYWFFKKNGFFSEKSIIALLGI